MVAWLTGSIENNLAPASDVIVAAVVSRGTVLTLKESACRRLPDPAPTEVAAR